MAAHQHFDLDQLGSTAKFEQLCYALLLHFFGPEVIPYGALGPDGGIDARLDGAPPSYTSFEGIPLIYGTKKFTKPGFWVFQAKYHQRGSYNKKTPISDLEKEWTLWRKKRKPKPDCFLFMTNIVFTPGTHKEFLKKSKKCSPFKFFDYWDGEKIAALIAANSSIRSSFFPNCEDQGPKLDRILDAVTEVRKKTKKKTSKKGKKVKSRTKQVKTRMTYFSSVEELASYEAAFASANTEIVDRFKKSDTDVPKTWKKVEILASGEGILQLAEQGKDIILRLISASESQSVIVRLWHKFLGEHVNKGETIVSLSYDPDDEELIEQAKKSLFSIAPGSTDFHVLIDKGVKEKAQIAISALRQSDSFAAEDALRQLFRLRSQYIEARRKYGLGFYPNSRRLGRMTFGWSFISLWDDAFERICDVLLTQQQPDDLYRLVGNIPEALANTAIDNRLPPEEIVSELTTFTILLFKAQDRQVDRLKKLMLEDLEDVFDHFHDLNHRMKGLTDAEWAFPLAQSLVDFAAELGRHSLSKKLDIDFGYAKRLVGLATGIHYSHAAVTHDGSWTKNYDRLKELDAANSGLQHEANFAFGTYAWFLCRRGKKELSDIAVSELRSLSVQETVRFYSRRDGLRRWYSWWFNPEGKRAAWSSRVDHDIREALLLRLALGPTSVEDLLPLALLESESSTEELLKDLSTSYDVMESLSVPGGIKFEDLKGTILSARKEVTARWKEKIRSEKNLSERKIKKTEESFTKTLAEQDPKGQLYQVAVETSSEFKPTHFVGVYSVQDKEWFLDDTGYASYSVGGMGSNWAENIIHGRESLIINELKAKLKFSSVKLPSVSEVLQKISEEISDEFVMLLNSISIPWQLQQKFFKNEYQAGPGARSFAPGQLFRIGNVDVFPGRRLGKGQFTIFPKDTFVWATKRVCEKPRVALIDPASEEGIGIKKKYPEMDLDLKMIVEARELGTMRVNAEAFKRAQGWRILFKDESELY